MASDPLSTVFFSDASAAALAAALHAECFSAPWNEASFRSALNVPGTTLQILSLGETPVAFALYRQVLDECEILTLGTCPDYRGRGYAGQLLELGVAYLRELKAERLLLEVGAQNLSARRLYLSSGFKEIGQRPGYYLHGETREDAILMLKNLH
jgi:ribosomal-protein-alanine N-acetyltransferase